MKTQAQTDAEILTSAKAADVVSKETSSTIRIRNSESVHPIQCECLIHRNLKLREFSTPKEIKAKAELDWYQ